mmetsp:Transcript_41715/g.126572  ORF Transcript_41715/g.126572 Transcript_41715/m.126572 type:complete len:83 (+) Transcript_41715:1769-2017(+)
MLSAEVAISTEELSLALFVASTTSFLPSFASEITIFSIGQVAECGSAPFQCLPIRFGITAEATIPLGRRDIVALLLTGVVGV